MAASEGRLDPIGQEDAADHCGNEDERTWLTGTKCRDNGRWHSTLGVQTNAGMVVLDSLSSATAARLNFRPAYYLEMHDTSSWRIAR